MNNAELIVQTLKRAGVTTGFGIPSGNVLPLMEAMRKWNLPFVLTAHEGSAGFAADVMGRMNNAPGLAIATLGPGATNLATGVGNAWLDRSPMIAITCNLNTDQLGRRLQMYIDHHKLFEPITKATLPISIGSVADTVAEAISIALSEPAGPVHLDLPEDVALSEATEEIPIKWELKKLELAPKKQLVRSFDVLKKARRPIAVLGSNAMRIGNIGNLQALIEKHEIPFATTTMAKGLIDESHPLSIGCIERAKRQIQREFLQTTDLIIGLGYDTVEVEYEAWIGKSALLHVDIEKADTIDSVNLVAELIGDLDKSLEELASVKKFDNDWKQSELVSHQQRFQQELRPFCENFSPHHVIDVARDVMPQDGILCFDVGAHTHQIASQWIVNAPRKFHITNGWSSMGFGLPAAIAAKLSRPDLPVTCILGDGCFQMTCGELATAKRLGLCLPIIVLDDRWLG